MTTVFRLRQISTIARLQLRRVFFARRSLWVYLLALFPSVIFFAHGLEVKIRGDRWAGRKTPAAVLDSIQRGDSDGAVLERAGTPLSERTWRPPDGDGPSHRFMTYFDGRRRVDLHFEAGILQGKSTRTMLDFEEDRTVYAAVFQYFYLRCAIFFGCLGIFMNLFRGEMLDKTLHFWFLAPARREVLLAGKYLAGLIAASVIFTLGVMLCFGIMLWPQDPAELQAYWQQSGPSHLLRYAAAAALGCVGYGSVFLAAGLLLRNPIIPAAVLVLWENINGFLPAMLQKLSVLYYVQSLCPVPAPVDPDAPALVRLLLAPAEPASAASAVFGLLGVAALVLWSASRAVRKLEINYGTD
ncbi:MAG: hypothetical protein HYZ57_08120 [Acidobacteria bacterium]|nr:hypothetical protein [Acidobacteriota bacterium]MBI3279790.1 hypothetical protein [Acidobacteriota bacterium]